MENKENALSLGSPSTDMTLKAGRLLGPRRTVCVGYGGPREGERGNAQLKEEMKSWDSPSLASPLSPLKLEIAPVALLWEREEETSSKVDGSEWEAVPPVHALVSLSEKWKPCFHT